MTFDPSTCLFGFAVGGWLAPHSGRVLRGTWRRLTWVARRWRHAPTKEGT